MLDPVRWVVCFLGRLVLGLRYWFTVSGLPDAGRHPGPYLVLPNHPAYAEPPNVLARLWPWFKPRPMLMETNFQNPFTAPFGWLFRAIHVPDTEKTSAEVRDRAAGAVQTAIDARTNAQPIREGDELDDENL